MNGLDDIGKSLVGGARDLLGRLHRGEEGATMTEFVIILPVFLIIFAGILKVTLLQSTTVQLKMAATSQLWRNTAQAQFSRAPGSNVDPRPAGSNAVSTIGATNFNHSFSNGVDSAKANGLRRDGTTGESAAALSSGSTPLDTQANLGNLPPSVSGQVRPTDQAILTRTGHTYTTANPNVRYTRQLVDDRGNGRTQTANLPAAPAPLNNMNISGNSSQSVPAFAAGIRYGMASSRVPAPASAVNQLPFVGPGDLVAGYDTLIAPYPIVDRPGSSDTFRPVGTARRFMEQYNQYDQLLGIERTRNLLRP